MSLELARPSGPPNDIAQGLSKIEAVKKRGRWAADKSVITNKRHARRASEWSK